ncbi:MAG: ABC transporter substrate-binding protein [Syntrophales bacterium]
MQYRTFTRVIFCLAVIVGLATGTPAEAQAQAKKALTQITVLAPGPSAVTTFNFFVADGEGYFRDEGLEAKWEAVDGSSQVLQGVASGKAQFGRPGPGPLLAARGRGLDVVWLYNLYPKSIFGLVVKKDARYKVPGDLKGKVIGVGTADGAEVAFVRPMLTDAGMKEGKDYTFLPVGDGGMAAAAFLRGDIEAYAASITSDAAVITRRGLPLRDITPEKYLNYFGNGFVAMGSYIKANPEVIKGFGRAMVRGTKFGLVKANRAKVLQYCKKGNPQEGEDTVLANAVFDMTVDRMTSLDTSKGWGYNSPAAWKLWHENVLATGFLKAPLPKLEDAYTNQFVNYWNGK